MKYFIILFFLTCSICVNAQNGKIKKISPKKLERKIKKDIQLVDVRSEKEFDQNCVSKAININIEDSTFTKKIELLDKKKPVYVYCRSGKRSDKAAQKMKALGFSKIYDLKGGVLAWEENKNTKAKK